VSSLQCHLKDLQPTRFLATLVGDMKAQVSGAHPDRPEWG